MKFFGLETGFLEKFDTNGKWFKENLLYLLNDRFSGHKWPYWSDKIADERIIVEELYPHILERYCFSYINMVYRMPPPVYCIKTELIDQMGVDSFTDSFVLFPFYDRNNSEVPGWVCVKERAEARLLSENALYDLASDRGIYASEKFPMILREDIYERVSSFCFFDCEWRLIFDTENELSLTSPDR